MSELAIATTSGSFAAVPESAVSEYRAALRGAVLSAADPGYDDARKIWNGMTKRRPALIAQCRGTADVMTSIKFAKANGLLVAVKGGGHSIVWREGKEIDTGKIAVGRMEKTLLTMRVMMPDGSSCRFSGQPSGDSIKGGYSCQGAPRAEQGT